MVFPLCEGLVANPPDSGVVKAVLFLYWSWTWFMLGTGIEYLSIKDWILNVQTLQHGSTL